MGKRTRKQARRQSGDWGVIQTRSSRGYGHGTPVWLTQWMDLAEDGNLSVDIDPDRAATTTPVTWGRARRALGHLPQRILVADEETAARVRRVAPSRVEVVAAPDDPRLRAMAAMCQDGDGFDDELDLVPFPVPRARC
jgi:hypothetical protein